MDGLLHLVQQGAARVGWAAALPSPLLTVLSVTSHPSTVSVPTSYYSKWHYNYLCTLKRVKVCCTILHINRLMQEQK